MRSKLFRGFPVLFCLFFFSVSWCIAQSERGSKFGEVSPDEFALVASGADSAATALKIFDIGHCDFSYSNNRGFTYVFKRHVRYKILNKNAYDLANMDIALFKLSSGSAKEQVLSMSAATYNLENGKIVESKLAKDAKFTETLDRNYTIKKYALPNVREGSIIEFRYAIESDFIFTLRGWSFQGDIPTLWSEYNVRIPEYFNYKVNINGYQPIEQPIRKVENVTYVPGLASTAQYVKYTGRNMPALKDEPFVTSLDDYRAKVEFELQGTRFPNQPYENFTGNWSKILQSLMEDKNFGQYIDKKSHAKTMLSEVKLGDADGLTKIKRIHAYLRNRVKWNDEYSLYTDHLTPKALFDKRSGNSADINLALIGLLKAAGITVYPVLVSTRRNGLHPGYPVISKFNNVVALAVVDSTSLLLDACDQLMPVDMLSFQNLSHQGFLFDTDRVEGQWISLESGNGGESAYHYNLTLDTENALSGNVIEIHKGYNGLSRRNRYRAKTNEAEYIKDYKEDRAGLDVLTYEIANIDSVDMVLTEKLTIAIADYVEGAGDLVYFSPLLYERTKENPFKHDERKFPVDFGFPTKETYRITLNFPENYAVEKLPQSILYKLPDDNGSFRISYLSEGKVLMVASVIELKKSFFSTEEYFDLRELFKIITERQAEQIVFKKI